METDLAGTWQGFTGEPNSPLYVEVELGSEQSFMHCSELGLVYMPLDVLVVTDHVELKASLLKLSVTVKGEALVGQVQSPWFEPRPIMLVRNHPYRWRPVGNCQGPHQGWSAGT